MHAKTSPGSTAWASATPVLPCICSAACTRPLAPPRLTAVHCIQQRVRDQDPDGRQRGQWHQHQQAHQQPVGEGWQQRRQQAQRHAAARQELRAISNSDGRVPEEAVWIRELHPFKNIMNDANRPWARSLVLELCYVRNTPESRSVMAYLSPMTLNKVLNLRYIVERGTSSAMHALQQLQHRTTLLEAFMLEEGGVMTEAQAYKERDDLGQARLGIKDTQLKLNQALLKAPSLGDEHYKHLGTNMARLLDGMAVYAVGSLKPQLSALIASSEAQRLSAVRRGRIKRNRAAPQQYDERQCSPEEIRRMGEHGHQQLMDLLAEYRSLALQFDGYQDAAVFDRPACTGQPTSTGGRPNRPPQPHADSRTNDTLQSPAGDGDVAAGDSKPSSSGNARSEPEATPHRLQLAPAWLVSEDLPLSGKAMPPMSVLWHRALRVEAAELAGNKQTRQPQH